ncbi:MAG: ABC transporter ATP-binding protein, partial [Pseudonocardiaceae bacterium]
VDSATELDIRRGLARLSSGRTTLVVAHRLSTIRDADRVLVLEEGDVVESGTHDELVSTGGLYSSLYSAQFSAPGQRVP